MAFQKAPEFLIATVASVSVSAALSSLNFGISYLSVPSLLLSAPKASDKTRPQSNSGLLARQWQYIYDIGKVTGPPLSAVSSGSLIYAMTRIPKELKTQRQLYIAAVVLTLSIMPFTLIVLAPTNNKLLATAATEEKGEEAEKIHPGNVAASKGESTADLIRHWAVLNAVRGIPPIIGIGCIVTALVM